MQRNLSITLLFVLTATLLLTRCANPVTPSGGPKDIDPPVVVASDPPQFSTGFTGNEFKIDFDEFILARNTSTEVFVSPPLNTIPEIKVRGKSLLVKMNDTLLPDATYSFGFGNAIADITENNIIADLRYVFSTGAYIDSLTLSGAIVDAFDLKPQKSVLIGLYINNNDTLALDSLPLHIKPAYVTRSDDQGAFTFRHLRQQPFKLFAMADLDGNMVFNQPTEKIAFSDSLVSPVYIPPPVTDSSSKDTTQTTVPTNTIHRLFLFSNNNPVQQILKKISPDEKQALLVFRNPARPTTIKILSPDTINNTAVVEEFSSHRDSLYLWFNIPSADTVKFYITDTAGFADTITIALNEVSKKKKGTDVNAKGKLKLLNPVRGNTINQFKGSPVFHFSDPLSSWDFTGARLINGKDTTRATIGFTDTIYRKISISHNWLEEQNYRLLIPAQTLQSFTGRSNDTIRLDFRTKAEKDYGTLVITMNMDNRPGQYIIQLLNEKDEIGEEKIIEGTSKITFGFITPATYRIRAIHDKNRNGRWDTGEYAKGLQPEPVVFYPSKIEIRANWEVEETWN